MRLPRFRLRTLMITIAFLALILTVFMQSVLLRRAAVREEYLRAQEAQRRAAEERDRAAMDQILEQLGRR